MRISRQRANPWEILRTVFLFALAACFLYPFVLTITISLDTTANMGLHFPPTLLPKEFGLKNYSLVFRTLPVTKYYLNSMIVVVGGVIFHLVGATLAGYALSKGSFRGKRFWMIVILSPMMIPEPAVVFSRFIIFNHLHLTNKYIGVILPSLAWPFGVLMFKQFLDSLPNELGDSAKIDGAGHWKTFTSIYLPLTKPVLATLSIITVMWKWNELLWPLLMLTRSNMYTIAIGVASFTLDNRTVVGNSLALAALTMLPVITVFIVLQRYVIQSVVSSGIKQ